MGAVDAAHAEDGGGQSEGAGVIEDVLVGGAFGAAVGAVEIEGALFADAAAAEGFVFGLVALSGGAEADVGDFAVYFVS